MILKALLIYFFFLFKETIKTLKGKIQKSLLYKTSDLFLDIFGLHSIEELKNIKDFNEGIKKL